MTEQEFEAAWIEVCSELRMSMDGVYFEAAVMLAKKAIAVEREACAGCVPTNWCDPMLTGPDSVIGKVADCRPIEAVLAATKARIMARSN